MDSDVIPGFLNFNLYDEKLKDTSLYKDTQRRFLLNELKSKEKEVNSVQKLKCKVFLDLRNTTTYFDFHHLQNLIHKFVDLKMAKVLLVHEKKLSKIGVTRCDLLPKEKVLFNLSSRVLSESEQSLLCKGLKYVFPSKKLKLPRYLLDFENLYKDLGKLDIFTGLNNERESTARESFKTEFRNLAFTSFSNFKKKSPKSNLTPNEIAALKSLKKDKSIVICKPDKGNAVVVMDRTDYVRKVMVILNDGSKFKKVEADPFKLNFKQEEKINRFLLKTIGHIDADGKHCDTYNRLHTKGSSLGIMYGLPKIHKKDTPIRPILSAINTPGYNLAQYLVPVIAPLTTSEFTVRDTFTFVEEITKIDSKNTFMASFDVKSLFTNIPLEETISIIINELFQNKEVLEVKLENSGDIVYYNKTDFKSLLDLATLENHFIFNEDIYCQVDGVAMGSPLGPTLANAFMCHLEKAFLKSFPEDQLPLIYKRYVDDVFLVFRSEEHVEPFLKFMNSLHKNIEFTCEREENNKLSFIGVDVERGEGNFVTSVFRKPTYTGLLTKFDSFIPERYKQNLISIMVYRAFHICSNYMNFHIEIEFLRDIFQKKWLPTKFLPKYCIKNFEKNLQTLWVI